MESQPQNLEFRINPKKFTHECSTFVMFKWWLYMLFWREMKTHHLTLRQPESNLAGNDVTSPLTTRSHNISHMVIMDATKLKRLFLQGSYRQDYVKFKDF